MDKLYILKIKDKGTTHEKEVEKALTALGSWDKFLCLKGFTHPEVFEGVEEYNETTKTWLPVNPPGPR